MSTNAVSTKQPRMPKPSQVKISKLWSQCFHLFGLVTKFETFHWIRNSTLCPNPFIFLLRLSFMESLGFLKDFLHVSFHPGSWTGRTSCLFGDWSTSVSLEQVAPPLATLAQPLYHQGHSPVDRIVLIVTLLLVRFHTSCTSSIPRWITIFPIHPLESSCFCCQLP